MQVSLNFLLGFHWTYYMCIHIHAVHQVWEIIYSNKPVFSLSCLSGTPMIIHWSTWWRPINSLSLFTFLHFFSLFCLSDLIISNFFMFDHSFLSTCLNVLLNFSSDFFQFSYYIFQLQNLVVFFSHKVSLFDDFFFVHIFVFLIFFCSLSIFKSMF